MDFGIFCFFFDDVIELTVESGQMSRSEVDIAGR